MIIDDFADNNTLDWYMTIDTYVSKINHPTYMIQNMDNKQKIGTEDIMVNYPWNQLVKACKYMLPSLILVRMEKTTKLQLKHHHLAHKSWLCLICIRTPM